MTNKFCVCCEMPYQFGGIVILPGSDKPLNYCLSCAFDAVDEYWKVQNIVPKNALYIQKKKDESI